MDLSGASTVIMLGVAAVLWFLYFVPTWARRREYLATERTATRLQQTLRVMAETAEVPEPVEVEVTAREAARRERMLAAAERQAMRQAMRDAEAAHAMREEIARMAAAPRGTAGRRVASVSTARARQRRGRRLAGLLLLAATVVAGAQLSIMATTGIAPGAWAVLAGSIAAGTLSVGMQRRIATRVPPVAQVAAPARTRTASPVADTAPEPAVPATWTPVPLPKPLYVTHPEARSARPALASPTMDSASLLRAAAAEAERAQREAASAASRSSEPGVVPIRSAPSVASRAAERDTGRANGRESARDDRYARMGIVDAAPASVPDLDEVLRRRRNAG